MDISPFSDLARRARVRGCGRYWVLGIAGALAGGCVFDLGELQVGAGGAVGGGLGGESGLGGVVEAGTGGTTAGVAGADPVGGSINVGGGGGLVDTPRCPSGQKLCDDDACRPAADPAFGCGDTACQPCAVPSRSTVACSDSGQCIVTACEDGWGDCNGDTDAGQDLAQSDGCEYSFGTLAGFSDPIDAPFKVIQLDGQRDDWAGVSVQRLVAPCADCLDVVTPPIANENTRPPARDLDAYFRTAWDNDFLYVLSEVYDDHLFSSGVDLIGQKECRDGAECEDSIVVMVDGLSDGGSGNDDRRVFLGLSNGLSAPSQGRPSDEQVSFSAVTNGPHCYRVEAQLDWQFIASTQNGQPVNGVFPPVDGQSYGFDVAVSDVDPSAADAQAFQRQSTLFWVSPGPNYRFETSGYGALQLSGGSQ